MIRLDDVSVTYPGSPFKIYTDSSWANRSRAPLIGEHNWEIYEEELGLSHEEVSRLQENGVI